MARNSLSESETKLHQALLRPYIAILLPAHQTFPLIRLHTKQQFPGAAGPWETFQSRLFFFFACVIQTVNFVSELTEKGGSKIHHLDFAAVPSQSGVTGWQQVGFTGLAQCTEVFTLPKTSAAGK